MSPRVAQAVGSLGHTCGSQPTVSLGSWCDRNTGTTVEGSGEAPTASSSPPPRPSAPARDPVMLPAGELPFVCRSASGLEDEVIAPDLENAIRNCRSMTGEPCECRIPEEARRRIGDDAP